MATEQAETPWRGYWCPDCGNVDENHRPVTPCPDCDCEPEDHDTRGCKGYTHRGQRLVRCPCTRTRLT